MPFQFFFFKNGDGAGGILKNIDIMAGLAQWAGPDKGFNDPCLLLSVDWSGKMSLSSPVLRFSHKTWPGRTITTAS